MANKSTVIRVTHTKQQVNPWDVGRAASDARTEAGRIVDLFERIACGLEPCKFEVEVAGTALVRASATVTCAAVQAGDTVTINGVVFTSIANAGTPSGNQFRIGTGGGATQNNACAANLAAIINASATAKIAGYVYATVAGAVVTVSARAPGVLGNMCTLVSSDGSRLAVTGSGYLASGAGANAVATIYDRS